MSGIRPEDRDIVAVFTQTLLPGQSIKKIYLIRSSNGVRRQVIVKEHGIVINKYEKAVQSLIVASCVLSLKFEDIVLVTLQSGWLLALRILPDSDIPSVVGYMGISVSSARSNVESLGQYLCCDPRGRFIAVSAVNVKNTICQLDTKNLDALSDGRNRFFIHTSRRNLDLKDSVILDSCFLYPATKGNDDPTYLAVLHVTTGVSMTYTRVTYYQLDNRSISSSNPATTSFALDKQDDIPLFLIPVACSSGLVIRTTEYLIYIRLSDVISGNRNIFTCEFNSRTVAYFHDPFAATVVNKDVYDTFYMTTDDGKLYKIEVDKAKLTCTLFADLQRDLGCTFTLQAFDSINGPTDGQISSSEYVKMVYGGDLILAQSIVFSTELDEYGIPVFVEYEDASENSSRNSLAPVFDGQLIERSGKSELFCCSGIEENGSIAHLKYCIKASLYLDGPKQEHISRLFSVKNSAFQYIIVGYPWRTTAYFVAIDDSTDYMPSLEEIPDGSGLEYNKATLAVGISEYGNVIQVVPDEIRITDMEGNYFAFSLLNSAEKAVINGKNIIIACQATDKTALKFVWFHLKDVNFTNESNEWIFPVAEAETISELSFIRYIDFQDDNQHFCLIGTYDGKIMKFDEKGTLTTFKGVEWENKIPHDAICFKTKKGPQYMISLRDGSCSTFVMTASQDTLRLLHSSKMGEMPMEFFYTDDNRVWGINGGLICLYSDTTIYPKPTVLAFEKATGEIDAKSMKGIISNCCPISLDDSDDSSLLIILNNQLKFIRLSKYPESIVLKIPLKRTPRRLVYMDHIEAFAVAVESKISSEKLAFVDPNKYRLLRTTYREESMLESGEEIFSLLQWKCIIDNNEYRFLVVGTGFSNGQGKIRILTIKRKSAGIMDVKCRYSLSTPGNVLSIFQLSNTAICYSVQSAVEGKVCEAKLDWRGIRSFQLSSVELFTAKDTVLDMAWSPSGVMYQGHIFTAGLQGSTDILEVSNCHMFMTEADSVSRNSISCLTIGIHQSLLCDKAAWVVLFEIVGSEGPSRRSCRTAFQVQMPSIVGRLREGKFLPCWLNDDIQRHPLTNARRVAGIGIDGSVYGLTLLTKSQLQQVQREMSIVKKKPPKETDIECAKWSNNSPNINVFDGQIMKGELGEISWLSKMLCRFEL